MQSLLLLLAWENQHWIALFLLLLEFSSYPLNQRLGQWQDYGDGWGDFSTPNFLALHSRPGKTLAPTPRKEAQGRVCRLFLQGQDGK